MTLSSGDVSAPSVSICVPTHRPRYGAQAIESALAQRYADFEVVISDDSGTDVLEAIVRNHADGRIRYFRNERTLGYPDNLSLALDRARGRIVGLLQDDDRWLPEFLERVMPCFESDPSLGLAFTQYYFDRDGIHVRPPFPSVSGGRYQVFLPLLLRHKLVNLSAVLMRRSVWERLRPLPDLHQADYALFIRACLAGFSFYYVDSPLAIYRHHPGQMTTNELEYRDDEPRLWRMFRFDDPECERLRRSRLAAALVSQAASRIKRRRYREAQELSIQAGSLGSVELSIRERAVAMAARQPALARIAAWLWPLTGSARRVLVKPHDRWPTLQKR